MDIKDLIRGVVESQATMARLEKERMQEKVKQAKEKLPEIWAEIG